MNVFMAATSFPRDENDWRGRFIERMVRSLATHRRLKLALWAPPGELPGGVAKATSQRDTRFLNAMLHHGGIAHMLRERPLHAILYGVELLYRLNHAMRLRPDTALYHINWLQNALAVPDDGKPILITALGSDLQMLRLPGMVPLLRRVMKRHRCWIAPNSYWMARPLQLAFGDVSQVGAVPFGIDPSFFVLERAISATPRRWLVVSRVTRAKIGPLFEWGESLFGQADELHVIGPMQEPLPLPAWIHYHGPMSLEHIRQEWLPHISALITLSRHSEGLPQIILESMAAGVPIIASSIPAHRDAIAHGRCGFLVDSPAAFRHAVERLQDPLENQSLGGAARKLMVSQFGTWADTATRYISVYDRLMEA